ncbi:hypothetical protein TNCV_3218661 [Trichonephila clavipes]|nr:hypothetical protein TNCV_3218661 [Trichonephila clavipes]
MPRKRKSNLSQRSNSALAMKVARFNETFPQAELRSLEQAERVMQLTELLRHQSGPKLGVFSMQLTCRLREIQKPLKQLNLVNVLLLKGHNSDV